MAEDIIYAVSAKAVKYVYMIDEETVAVSAKVVKYVYMIDEGTVVKSAKVVKYVYMIDEETDVNPVIQISGGAFVATNNTPGNPVSTVITLHAH